MRNEQNNIGLIIADDNEILNMKEFILINQFKNETYNVNQYSYLNKNIFVIHSRIGLVNAAMATQYLIDTFDINQIWNYGAVGGYKDVELFEVVCPNKFYFFDVITPWYKRGQMPNENQFYLNNLSNEKDVNIGSGNSFINDVDYLIDLNKEIHISLIDMEASAIAQVCYRNKIDFYCIKCVSDLIGNTNTERSNINSNITKAAQKAFDYMIKIWNEN